MSKDSGTKSSLEFKMGLEMLTMIMKNFLSRLNFTLTNAENGLRKIGQSGNFKNEILIEMLLLSGVFSNELNLTSLCTPLMFTGGITIVWYIVWILFIYNDPSEDKFISLDEQKFINENVAITTSKTVG